MIGLLLVAASVAAAAPQLPAPSLAEAEHAIAAGRLEQARLMIGRALSAGVSGPQIERLLADLAYASGKNDEALSRYRQLLLATPNDSLMLERAGICALRLGDIQSASALIARATKAANASWRAWNARGVIADLRQDWTAADIAYAEAARLSGESAEVLNNEGWSLLLRGDWARATTLFERAAKLDRHSARIANNLELARTALAGDLPSRRPGESDRSWAERLNDAGMAARLLGDNQRAIAAFTQALRASGTWYDRAANNLQMASGK
jgi:Flp pilus assembly protein TadD